MVRTLMTVLSSARRRYFSLVLPLCIASLVVLASCGAPLPELIVTPAAPAVVPSLDDDLVLVLASEIPELAIPDEAWVIAPLDGIMPGTTQALTDTLRSLADYQPGVAISPMANLSGNLDNVMVLVPEDALGNTVEPTGDLYSSMRYNLSAGRFFVSTPADVVVSDRPIDGVWTISIRPSTSGILSSNGIMTQTITFPGIITLEILQPRDCPECDFVDVCRHFPGCCRLVNCATQ